IPIAYGKGVVGWIGNNKITKLDEELVHRLLSPLGLLLKCKTDEALEKLSMISGCGAGYVSYFMKNLKKVAQKYGFSENEAYKIVLMTFLGTVYHLQSTGLQFEEMLTAIATKGGITEEVVKSLDERKFYQIFEKSINNGYVKIGKITKELENENF
ncbi:hypothetical protein HY945_04200, partial [Candidatus Gottesmanbacteria bacterium]|nr:hypothetical protein [Candidatus Gottesmanbacteria bacterium]